MRTEALAIEAAQSTSRQGEQHLLAHYILKQQTAFVIIPYLRLVFRNGTLPGIGIRAFRTKQQVEAPLKRQHDRFYAARTQNLKCSPVLGPDADIIYLLLRPAMFHKQIGLALHRQRP